MWTRVSVCSLNEYGTRSVRKRRASSSATPSVNECREAVRGATKGKKHLVEFARGRGAHRSLTCKRLLAYCLRYERRGPAVQGASRPGAAEAHGPSERPRRPDVERALSALGHDSAGCDQHLAVLEAANLVAVQWRGREELDFLN